MTGNRTASGLPASVNVKLHPGGPCTKVISIKETKKDSPVDDWKISREEIFSDLEF